MERLSNVSDRHQSMGDRTACSPHIEEGDQIFLTLTDAHDTPEGSASPVSYHSKILDFEGGDE